MQEVLFYLGWGGGVAEGGARGVGREGRRSRQGSARGGGSTSRAGRRSGGLSREVVVRTAGSGEGRGGLWRPTPRAVSTSVLVVELQLPPAVAGPCDRTVTSCVAVTPHLRTPCWWTKDGTRPVPREGRHDDEEHRAHANPA